LLCRDRFLSVVRRDRSPVWNRSFPLSKKPQTIGEHLRKKRFTSHLGQAEVAEQLKVSQRTLSLWERDYVHPSWSRQREIAAFLGYNPFVDPFLGRPRGNETTDVAIFLRNTTLSFGQLIKKHRLELRKTRNQCARELGVSVKTLWSWESGRREPSTPQRIRLSNVLRTELSCNASQTYGGSSSEKTTLRRS
jgi:transcriptional regulator with XRE-family HTH domain